MIQKEPPLTLKENWDIKREDINYNYKESVYTELLIIRRGRERITKESKKRRNTINSAQRRTEKNRSKELGHLCLIGCPY